MTLLTLTSFFFVGEAFAKHHRRDNELDTYGIGVRPSKLSHKEKKRFRKETKRRIKADKLSHKEEKRQRKSIKKQIDKEKRQQRKEKKRIDKEQKEKGSKKNKRKTLTLPEAQAQIHTLMNKFRISKKFKDSKKYMKGVESLKREHPTTVVQTMTLHVTKKKKRSFGRTKKSQRVYILGPQTNYRIKKI